MIRQEGLGSIAIGILLTIIQKLKKSVLTPANQLCPVTTIIFYDARGFSGPVAEHQSRRKSSDDDAHWFDMLSP